MNVVSTFTWLLMNSSEASPSVAESPREEVGGVKEGVTLYKYQFN